VAESYDFGPFGPKLIFRRDRYLRAGDHSAFNEQDFAQFALPNIAKIKPPHQDVRTEKGIEYADLLKFVDFRLRRKLWLV